MAVPRHFNAVHAAGHRPPPAPNSAGPTDGRPCSAALMHCLAAAVPPPVVAPQTHRRVGVRQVSAHNNRHPLRQRVQAVEQGAAQLQQLWHLRVH